MRPIKTAVITDLDNTLFDWVELWFNCFSPMLDGIVEISGIPKEKLIPEISAVHKRHGTSEYSFLIEELPSLQPILNGRSATEIFATPIEIYRQQRRKHLRLYPTVAETLLRIKGHGAVIIGYTESMAFYSNYRIRRLGLDGVLDYVFYPEDHLLPEGLSAEDIRKYPAEYYELKYTRQDFTPKGSKKPDTTVLNAIVSGLGLTKVNCVYVGDNLMKDVAMAHDCGVDNVWAKYGQAHKRHEYKLLQDVTHWTAEEVEREQKIKEGEHVHPTHTLEKTFSEILGLLDFRKSIDGNKVMKDEQRKQVIEIWKTIVEVQQHFNDISMRIRGLFVTILLALFASIGFLLDKQESLDFGSVHVRFATLIPLFGIVGTLLFYFIDRYWYHQLLVGSVNHAIEIEKKYKEDMPELSLSDAIGAASPYKPGYIVNSLARLLVRHEKYRNSGQLHSDGKIELFYKSVILVLILMMAMLAYAGGVTFKKMSLPARTDSVTS
ncbi:MAG: HAD family hydrolase, partial [Nitrososphaera sp.]|nr:HAD family hydrolase [Nitrososphaera sp.]